MFSLSRRISAQQPPLESVAVRVGAPPFTCCQKGNSGRIFRGSWPSTACALHCCFTFARTRTRSGTLPPRSWGAWYTSCLRRNVASVLDLENLKN